MGTKLQMMMMRTIAVRQDIAPISVANNANDQLEDQIAIEEHAEEEPKTEQDNLLENHQDRARNNIMQIK